MEVGVAVDVGRFVIDVSDYNELFVNTVRYCTGCARL